MRYYYTLVAFSEIISGRADIYISQCYPGLLWNTGGHGLPVGNFMEAMHRKGMLHKAELE